jgi:hypothetical protein
MLELEQKGNQAHLPGTLVEVFGHSRHTTASVSKLRHAERHLSQHACIEQNSYCTAIVKTMSAGVAGS